MAHPNAVSTTMAVSSSEAIRHPAPILDGGGSAVFSGSRPCLRRADCSLRSNASRSGFAPGFPGSFTNFPDHGSLLPGSLPIFGCAYLCHVYVIAIHSPGSGSCKPAKKHPPSADGARTIEICPTPVKRQKDAFNLLILLRNFDSAQGVEGADIETAANPPPVAAPGGPNRR